MRSLLTHQQREQAEEDQNEETIEVYLDDTSEVADGAAHTPVAMEDIEDILASLEQEAIDDNSGGEIQKEEIIRWRTGLFSLSLVLV